MSLLFFLDIRLAATDKRFQIGVMATSQESTILNRENSAQRSQEGAKDTHKKITSKASKLEPQTLLRDTKLLCNLKG